MASPTDYQSWYEQLLSLNDQEGDQLKDTADVARSVAAAVASSDLPEKAKSALLFMCSSLILNCGFDLRDEVMVGDGRGLAERALAGTSAKEALYFQCLYN